MHLMENLAQILSKIADLGSAKDQLGAMRLRRQGDHVWLETAPPAENKEAPEPSDAEVDAAPGTGEPCSDEST
jgi:hypothetical protein